jgi:hypothetical protein
VADAARGQAPSWLVKACGDLPARTLRQFATEVLRISGRFVD